MKLFRLTLVCSLLLLAAVPSFALPCRACTGPVYPFCEPNPDGGTRCQIGPDWCATVNAPGCVGFTDEAAATAVLAEWTVASIEISHPSQGTKAVTSPAAVAEANVPRDTVQK
jgi:hypothetical protein